jgi:hypothetical protein
MRPVSAGCQCVVECCVGPRSEETIDFRSFSADFDVDSATPIEPIVVGQHLAPRARVETETAAKPRTSNVRTVQKVSVLSIIRMAIHLHCRFAGKTARRVGARSPCHHRKSRLRPSFRAMVTCRSTFTTGGRHVRNHHGPGCSVSDSRGISPCSPHDGRLPIRTLLHPRRSNFE